MFVVAEETFQGKCENVKNWFGIDFHFHATAAQKFWMPWIIKVISNAIFIVILLTLPIRWTEVNWINWRTRRMRNVFLDKMRRGLIKLVVVEPRHRHRCLIANANQRCRKLHYEMHFNLARGGRIREAREVATRHVDGGTFALLVFTRLANCYLCHDRRRQSAREADARCTLHATALNCCPNLI